MSMQNKAYLSVHKTSYDRIIVGQLYGGGTSQEQQTQTIERLYPKYLLGNTDPLCIARVSKTNTQDWRPTTALPYARSDHILDCTLSDIILERIVQSCQQPPHNILVYSRKNKKINITSNNSVTS
jgi:hypothetical protein